MSLGCSEGLPLWCHRLFGDIAGLLVDGCVCGRAGVPVWEDEFAGSASGVGDDGKGFLL